MEILLLNLLIIGLLATSGVVIYKINEDNI